MSDHAKVMYALCVVVGGGPSKDVVASGGAHIQVEDKL